MELFLILFIIYHACAAAFNAGLLRIGIFSRIGIFRMFIQGPRRLARRASMRFGRVIGHAAWAAAAFLLLCMI